MRLLITKVWNWWDIALLKWCCLMYGVAAGVFLYRYLAGYEWLLLGLALLLTLRPAISYWQKEPPEGHSR